MGDTQQWLGQRGLCPTPQPASCEMPHVPKMLLSHGAPSPPLWQSERGWILTGPHCPRQPLGDLWVPQAPC